MCAQNHNGVLRKMLPVVAFPFFIVLFVVLLLVLFVAAVWFAISGFLQRLVTNLLRRVRGKSSRLYYVSRDCLIWSHAEARQAAQWAVDQFDLLGAQIEAEWPKVCHELAKEVLHLIENEATSSGQMYDLCRRIRKQAYGIRGIRDLWLLHDWLLERADRMKSA